MRYVGTTIRGIRTGVIKPGDNLEEVIINSLLRAKEAEGFDFHNRDVIGITEGVVGITEKVAGSNAIGNFATCDQIAEDIKNKYSSGHIGIVHPSPLSRNRLGVQIKSIARASKKITFAISFPRDEVGNWLFTDEALEAAGISINDTFDLATYKKYFSESKHKFTGINYIDYLTEVVTSENCEVDFVFTNNIEEILKYTKEVLVCNTHDRFKYKKILQKAGATTVLGLDDILTSSVDGSGYNPKYGLLGSNRITDEKVKLFPAFSQELVDNIQKKLYDLTGKTIEVMIFGDGAFKNPLENWELADPVVSPFYTKGLEGTPSEVKIKYLASNKFADLAGEDLNQAIKTEINQKADSPKGQSASLGTTPARLTDLIGSLCDLTTGSGDKGTPVVYISGYFDNLADD